VFRVLPSCSATFLTSSTLWKSGVCAAVSPFAFRYRSESVFRSLLLSVLSRKNPLSNFSWPQLLASCLTDSADSRWPLKLNRSNACSYGFAAPVFGPWNPYFCIRPCMYFDAVSSPSDGLLRPFSASDARYSMCFIGSESSFSGGGGGGGWSDLGWMVRPQLLSVPTSWRAASWTVSFQSPATGSPANGVRSKLPLMSSAEPPCRFDTTADFPEGEVSVTTRSPRYVCEMSRSSLSLSTCAVPSRWMVEVVVARSLIGAFGVALAVIGSAAAGRGPTNESFAPHAAGEEEEAWAQLPDAGAWVVEEVAEGCAERGRAAGSSRIGDALSAHVGGKSFSTQTK